MRLHGLRRLVALPLTGCASRGAGAKAWPSVSSGVRDGASWLETLLALAVPVVAVAVVAVVVVEEEEEAEVGVAVALEL